MILFESAFLFCVVAAPFDKGEAYSADAVAGKDELKDY